jgi:bilirubin oxidase
VVAATGTPITSIPGNLAPFIPYSTDSANVIRYLVFDTIRKLPADRPNLADGPFGINGRSFSMDSIDLTTHLNNTEIWVLKNNTYVAHPFHIHDVQFNVIEKSGTITPVSETGWKDVVLVMPQDSVKLITRFETFSNSTVTYMYHCHLLHHEDDGMMGSFLVLQPGANGISEATLLSNLVLFPNPTTNAIEISLDKMIETVTISDMQGRMVISHSGVKDNTLKINTSQLSYGSYMVSVLDEDHNIALRRFLKVY